MTSYLFKSGEAATGGYGVEITPEVAGWHYSGLRVIDLVAGEDHELVTGDAEWLVLPLAGSVTVDVDGQTLELAGRQSPFAVTDFAYLPRDTEARLTSEAGGRFALPAALADNRLTARYVPAGQVPVELRGAGVCSRQINNFCMPGVFETDRLIATEVLTPGGNWSSYPPHKHDEQRPGETQLEEIYYFEVAGDNGFGFQRAYSSGPDREIDVAAEVRTGDVICIPHGYHGPSIAAPGHDLYYLNVMAGPSKVRCWQASDDPAHAWIRASWRDQIVDERLPFTPLLAADR